MSPLKCCVAKSAAKISTQLIDTQLSINWEEIWVAFLQSAEVAEAIRFRLCH